MIYSLCSSNKDNLVQHHRILEERNVLIQTFKHFFKVLELPVEKKNENHYMEIYWLQRPWCNPPLLPVHKNQLLTMTPIKLKI